MSKYDFILDGITFSFSSISTYEQCNYAFKLTYIDYEDRGQNFWGEFGGFFHECMELYFNKEKTAEQVLEYYIDNYSENVTSSLPAFMKGKENEYYDKGFEFFSELNFPLNDYEILIIEDKIDLLFNGHKYVVKPDIVMKNKNSGKMILLDFKTGNGYKNGKLDKKKMEGYLKQFNLYVKGIWESKNIAIDEIWVWFVLNGKTEIVKVDPYEVEQTFSWFTNVIEDIYLEDEWKPNLSNKFFCLNLCSMYTHCEYAN